jgi:hypothetical protein
VIAGVYNLNIDQGATFERVITVKNPDESLYDFTDYTARMHIREEIDSDDFQVALTTENGGLTLGGALGTITLYLSPTATSALDDEGVYDLEIIAPNGKIYRLLKGRVRVDTEVTR